MRRFFVFLALLVSLYTPAQDNPSPRIPTDTSATIESLKNAQRLLDSINASGSQDQMQQNLLYFARQQQARRDRERKKAFLYIGLGLFFLVVLVVGMRRRSKK